MPFIEKIVGFSAFRKGYEASASAYAASAEPASSGEWFQQCVKGFGLKYEVTGPIPTIPQTGPVIFVANHPFGLADAVILGAEMGRQRRDLKFMANSLLSRIPEVQDWIIPVDPFGGEGSEQRNLGAMRKTLKYLRGGGALAIFPAGEVAHYKPNQGVQECQWTPHLASIVRATKATVVPVFFHGKNGLLFHLAGLGHRRLRTALLLREFKRQQAHPVSVTVGQPLTWSQLKHMDQDSTLTAYLRCQTLALQHRGEAPLALPEIKSVPAVPKPSCEPDMLAVGEIVRLVQNGAVLAEQGPFQVIAARADQIPVTLQTIGRLREQTFQAVGEGTGREIDLDEFDAHYLHLLLWDQNEAKLAGGYRMGQADVLLKKFGPRGLYTSTLFKFSEPFLKKLDCGLELGRSFIVAEYQKHPAALLSLWKGIANWVRLHPRYKRLFGPVSISDSYSPASREVMVEALSKLRGVSSDALLVKPRRPFRSKTARHLRQEWESVQGADFEDLSNLIATMEPDRKGLPVLIRQYLRMNGSILSFNVDKAFSNVVDGLILVDLTQTDPRLLAKYMGEEGVRAYRDHHGIWPSETRVTLPNLCTSPSSLTLSPQM